MSWPEYGNKGAPTIVVVIIVATVRKSYHHWRADCQCRSMQVEASNNWQQRFDLNVVTVSILPSRLPQFLLYLLFFFFLKDFVFVFDESNFPQLRCIYLVSVLGLRQHIKLD